MVEARSLSRSQPSAAALPHPLFTPENVQSLLPAVPFSDPTPPRGGPHVDPRDPELVTFYLTAPFKPAAALVRDFNGWNPHTHPMQTDGKGFFWLSVRLAGPTHYRFVVTMDGGGKQATVADPYAREVRWDAAGPKAYFYAAKRRTHGATPRRQARRGASPRCATWRSTSCACGTSAGRSAGQSPVSDASPTSRPDWTISFDSASTPSSSCRSRSSPATARGAITRSSTWRPSGSTAGRPSSRRWSTRPTPAASRSSSTWSSTMPGPTTRTTRCTPRCSVRRARCWKTSIPSSTTITTATPTPGAVWTGSTRRSTPSPTCRTSSGSGCRSTTSTASASTGSAAWNTTRSSRSGRTSTRFPASRRLPGQHGRRVPTVT